MSNIELKFTIDNSEAIAHCAELSSALDDVAAAAERAKRSMVALSGVDYDKMNQVVQAMADNAIRRGMDSVAERFRR